MSTKEQPPRGREVVVSRDPVPGTYGRVHVFRTEYDPNAEPISPELEQLIRNTPASPEVASLLAQNMERIKAKHRKNGIRR